MFCSSFAARSASTPSRVRSCRGILSTLPKLSASTGAAAPQDRFDVAVVGGGIVGLAAAQEMAARYPELTFAVLEKEDRLAAHQTGHNSGVIHAGIYYKPGSLMARLCVEGLHSTYAYCERHGIPYKKCGKLVVATDDEEVDRLDALFHRAVQNGVPDVRAVDAREIAEIEPACRGVKAIHSPHTGIVDWAVVAEHYGSNFKNMGGHVRTGFRVQEFTEVGDAERPIGIRSSRGEEVRAAYVLTCSGLHSDRVAAMTGCHPEPKIVPFRGEYLLLSEAKAKRIRGNIYPVPDPRFPFLGVHFTPRMNGEVWLGPNAVLAFGREGYRWGHVDFKDLAEILRYPGFYRLAAKYAAYGTSEMIRSIFIGLSVKELQKFVPDVTAADISRGPAGVRAQAMNHAGDLVGDFVFDSPPESSPLCGRVLHCRNAPSPGATSSLAIARMVADAAADRFGLPKRGVAKLY